MKSSFFNYFSRGNIYSGIIGDPVNVNLLLLITFVYVLLFC